jgi:hypothetical protein
MNYTRALHDVLRAWRCIDAQMSRMQGIKNENPRFRQ